MSEASDAIRLAIEAELLARVGGMERFRQSFSQRTFSPEKRARETLDDGIDTVLTCERKIRDLGGDSIAAAEWTLGFFKRWSAYQAAGARTMNWMITGPARFPVDRNNKRMETEHKRLTEMLEYRDGVEAWVKRRIRRAAAKAELTERLAADDGCHKEQSIGGLRIVENTALDRIQIVFPGKPSDGERALLKSRGFRWAPSLGVWQRQLTNNARWAAEYVAKKIAEAA